MLLIARYVSMTDPLFQLSFIPNILGDFPPFYSSSRCLSAVNILFGGCGPDQAIDMGSDQECPVTVCELCLQ